MGVATVVVSAVADNANRGKYLFSNSYRKDFENNCEKMIRESKSLYSRRDDLRFEMFKEKTQVTQECLLWMDRVTELEDEVVILKSKYAKQKKKMFKLFLPKKLSKQIAEISKELHMLLEQGKFEMGIFHNNVPEPVIMEDAPSTKDIKSQQLVVEQVLSLLKDEAVKEIGIWGVVGSGKTTIMMNLNNNEDIRNMFDIVIFITVNDHPTDVCIKNVQDTILEHLKLKKLETIDPNEPARRIPENFNGKKYLLLLDEVYRHLDLSEVGISRRNEQNDVKVVIASRYRDVCMITDHCIEVRCMSTDESLKMFRDFLGKHHREFMVEAQEIVKECSGIPLLIVEAANSLKYRDEFVALRTGDVCLCDVYLSFASEDQTLTDLLYKALMEKHITIFGHKDHALSRILEDRVPKPSSKISIVMFSRNYMTSEWCLNELERIMGRWSGHIVIPLYYNVTKSEVESIIHQRTYTSQFRGLEISNSPNDTVEISEAALSKASGFCGYTLNDNNYSTPMLVHEIASDIQFGLRLVENYAWAGFGGKDEIFNTMNLSVPDESKKCSEETIYTPEKDMDLATISACLDDINRPKLAQQAKYESSSSGLSLQQPPKTQPLPTSTPALGTLPEENDNSSSGLSLKQPQKTLSLPTSTPALDTLPEEFDISSSRMIDPSKPEEWNKSEVINLADAQLSVLPKNPRCSSLSALYLQRNHTLRNIPGAFFNHMPNLRLLNLSSTRIKSLPESVSKLINLEKLLLKNCELLMVLPPQIAELQNLEVLDLEDTDIMDLPQNTRELAKLTHLNLSFYESIDTNRGNQSATLIPSRVLSNLQNLKELNINVDPKDERWKNSVRDLIQEVCKLQYLNMLKFYFPCIQDLCKFMQLRSAMKTNSPLSFRFVVGQHAKRILVRIPSKVELELQGHRNHLHYVNDVSLPEVIKLLLRFTTSFYLDRHHTVKKLSNFGITNMKKLRYCVVGECNELQVIIDGEDVKGQRVLNSLEYLYVCYMQNLERFWEGPVQEECFSQLKSLTFQVCPKLTTIFTPMLLIKLVHLEELHIENCTELQRIVVKPDGFVGSIDTIYLPQLKEISLHYLPKLIGISTLSKEHPDLELGQNLDSMSIYGCPELKNIESLVVPSANLTKITCDKSWWDKLKWNEVRPDKLFCPYRLQD